MGTGASNTKSTVSSGIHGGPDGMYYNSAGNEIVKNHLVNESENGVYEEIPNNMSPNHSRGPENVPLQSQQSGNPYQCLAEREPESETSYQEMFPNTRY